MAMVSSTTNRRRPRQRQWAVIVLVAVLAHLILFLTVKQGFFEVFRRSVTNEEGTSSPRTSLPRAIVVVPVELESEAGEVALVEPEPETLDEPSDHERQGEDVDAVDILDVVGQSQAPVPATPTTRAAVVPPRPVEITWPDTDKLGHCLGLEVDIRIRVDAGGEVLRVEPVPGDHPADCTRAAREAARRIRFRPGTVDGKAEAMWTQIRIEFRSRNR